VLVVELGLVVVVVLELVLVVELGLVVVVTGVVVDVVVVDVVVVDVVVVDVVVVDVVVVDVVVVGTGGGSQVVIVVAIRDVAAPLCEFTVGTQRLPMMNSPMVRVRARRVMRAWGIRFSKARQL